MAADKHSIKMLPLAISEEQVAIQEGEMTKAMVDTKAMNGMMEILTRERVELGKLLAWTEPDLLLYGTLPT